MSTAYDGRAGAADLARTLFAPVMWYVAGTAGVFALGAYLGRNLGTRIALWALVALIVFGIVLIFGRRND